MQITNTTEKDFSFVLQLFEYAMQMRGKNGYITWKEIDHKNLQEDIAQGLQYKILKNDRIAGIFSIQHNDQFIWRKRDRDDAIYIHRAITHPDYKGNRLFEKILSWTMDRARKENRAFVRLDTVAENLQLLEYYQSYGFRFVETYTTPDHPELPLQNRDIQLTLMELEID